MNILIIEDEKLAAQKLIKVLKSILPNSSIHGNIETIDEAVAYLQTNKPDMIFLDIELSDGISFELFKRVQVTTPVIFTTAYNQYAIQAFEVNSVAYLLKPISEKDVKASILQYESMKSAFVSKGISDLIKSFDVKENTFQSSFLVKSGSKLIPISIDRIAYFFASDKWTYLITNEDKRYMVDYTLSKLENLLDSQLFIRVNRSYTCNRKSIISIDAYHKGQVAVQLNPASKDMVIVSRKRTPILKEWLINKH